MILEILTFSYTLKTGISNTFREKRHLKIDGGTNLVNDTVITHCHEFFNLKTIFCLSPKHGSTSHALKYKNITLTKANNHSFFFYYSIWILTILFFILDKLEDIYLCSVFIVWHQPLNKVNSLIRLLFLLIKC